MAFKRRFILKKRSDFLAIQSGTSVVGRYLVLCYKTSDASIAKVGYVVSRRIGNSVQRNRVKRRLREASFCLLRNNANKFVDLVFIAKKQSRYCSWGDLIYDMSFLLKRIKIL